MEQIVRIAKIKRAQLLASDLKSAAKEIARIANNHWLIPGVIFSPDGRWVVTTEGLWNLYGDQAQILLWDPETLIMETCGRLTRNLYLSEWEQISLGEPYHVTCDPNLYPNVIIPEDAQAYLDEQE